MSLDLSALPGDQFMSEVPGWQDRSGPPGREVEVSASPRYFRLAPR